jgi:hypothetical protein
MTHGPGRIPRDRSLQDAQRALARMAPVVRYGLIAVGFAVALDRLRPLVADGQFTWGERRVIAAVTLVVAGGFAMAGWAAGQLLQAAAGLIGAVAEGAEAAVRMGQIVESRLVPGVERAVAAIEALNAGSGADPLAPEVDAVRRAISEGRWTRAERLLDAFARDHPQARQIAALTAALSAARGAEADALRAKLDAALADDDAGTAITCRDALTRHLGGPELADLDRRVVRWISRWVRLRARGEVSADVASVAALAADRFGDTDEGRALLAAVPTLRRKAGLCPKCARPYRGPGETCPDCAADQPTRPARGARPRGVP